MQNEKETLLSLNAKELRSLAKERKNPYWYRMSKADLIDALEGDSDRTVDVKWEFKHIFNHLLLIREEPRYPHF